MSAVKEDKYHDMVKTAEKNRTEYDIAIKEQEDQKLKEQAAQEQKQQSIQDFKQRIELSDDLEDHLQELTDFLAVSFCL